MLRLLSLCHLTPCGTGGWFALKVLSIQNLILWSIYNRHARNPAAALREGRFLQRCRAGGGHNQSLRNGRGYDEAIDQWRLFKKSCRTLRTCCQKASRTVEGTGTWYPGTGKYNSTSIRATVQIVCPNVDGFRFKIKGKYVECPVPTIGSHNFKKWLPNEVWIIALTDLLKRYSLLRRSA
jgi:hypothetical protein